MGYKKLVKSKQGLNDSYLFLRVVSDADKLEAIGNTGL